MPTTAPASNPLFGCFLRLTALLVVGCVLLVAGAGLVGRGRQQAAVAYLCSGPTGATDVCLMDVMLRTFVNVTDDAQAYEFDPVWSPDGSQLALIAEPNRTPDLFTLDVFTHQWHQLTHDNSRDIYPVWSPDGSQLAFTSDRDRQEDIYIVNADGSNLRNLTRIWAADESYPNWSPDGTRIAFMSRRKLISRIYILPVSGARGQLVNLAPDLFVVQGPVWSPDGTQLVFVASFPQQYDAEIYLVNADGSNLRNLSRDPEYDFCPAWSPDGQHIAFSSNRSGNLDLYTVNVDGSNLRQITDTPLNDILPAWSADGTALVFLAQYGSERETLFVVDADGGNLRQLTAEAPALGGRPPGWQP